MKKGLSLLEVLFVIVIILKLMGFQPFASWSIFKVFSLLIVDIGVNIVFALWNEYGIGDTLKAEIDKIKYEKIILRREIRKAKLEQQKKLNERDLEKLKNK